MPRIDEIRSSIMDSIAVRETETDTTKNTLGSFTNQDTTYTNQVAMDVEESIKYKGFGNIYDYGQAGNQIFSGTGFQNIQPVEGQGLIKNTADFFVNLGFGFTDSALFGVPSLITDLVGAKGIGEAVGYDPWEEESTAGKWGRSIGIGLGLINPFKWVSKGLTWGAKGITNVALPKMLGGQKVLYQSMRKDAVTGFASKYAQKEGGEQVIAALSKIGGGVSDELTKVTSVAVQKGYKHLFDDAWSIVHDKAYKKMLKGSQEMLSQGIDEMTASIMSKAGGLSQAQARELAKTMVKEAMYHSHNSLHRLTNDIARKVLMGYSNKLLFKVPERFSKMVGMKAPEVYMGQLFGAMITDFAIGSTMFASEAVLHNLTVLGLSKGGDATGLWDVDLDGIDQRSKAFHTTRSDFGTLLERTLHSGLWMSLIGPTRFLKGGSNYGGRGMMQELKNGLGTIVKSFKPIGRMSHQEVKFKLELINSSADGMLHSRFSSLAGKKIKDLGEKEAATLLRESRKLFAQEWGSFIINEVGKDLTGSAPRMIAGAIAMNAEGVYEQLRHDPARWYQAFGTDGHEIAQNILMGMVFSKGGRSFMTGKKATWYETGEMRAYYGNNVNEMNKMRRGLELLGMDTSMFTLQQGSPVYESVRRNIRNVGFFKNVHELVKEFYVDRVAHEPTDAKESKQSFIEFIESPTDSGGLGYTRGSAEWNISMRKYNTFNKIVEIYDNTAPDVNQMFRPVKGKEIYDLVESINSLESVANAKDINLMLDNAVLKAYVETNAPYMDIRKNYVILAYKALGIDILPDSRGNLIIPDIGPLKDYFDNQKVVRKTQGNTAKHNLLQLIEQGVADGWIRKEGARTPTSSPKAMEDFVNAFEDAKLAMVTFIYGPENVKNGAYPMGGEHGDQLILINKIMQKASKRTQDAEQIRNTLSLFSRGKTSPEEVYHTLDAGKRKRILDMLQELKIDEDPVLNISNSNVDKHQEAIDFFSKVVELSRYLNPKGGDNKVEVSLEQVEGLKEAVFNLVGDSMSKTEIYNQIKDSAFDYFMNQLQLNQASSPNSVLLATQHLINGTRIGDKTGTINGQLGRFVIRTNDGLVMPDVEILIAKLKAEVTADVAKNIDESGIVEFYRGLQGDLLAAGNLIKFSKQLADVKRIVDTMGADKVVELLSQAKTLSEVGKIKDLMHKTIPLEEMQRHIASVADLLSTLPDVEANVIDNMKVLYNRTRDLTKLVSYAIANKDYNLLLNINQRKLELDTYMDQLDQFLNLDPKAEGDITLEYKQLLVEQIKNIDNFMSKDFGEINLENYSKYVKEELQKQKKTLPEKVDEMLINITPAQFEGRYGFSVPKVKKIIKTNIDLYKQKKDVTYIHKAYDALYDVVSKSQSKLPLAQQRSKETMITDVLQTVLTSAGMKEINKLKWMGDKFELSKDYLVNQHSQGVLAVLDLLGFKDNFYVLDKNMHVPDGKGGWKITRAPADSDLTVFENMIGTQKIEIEQPQNQLDLLKGILSPTAKLLIAPQEYIHVPLDESISLILPRSEAKSLVLQAFATNGKAAQGIKALFSNQKDPHLVDVLSKFSDANNLDTDGIVNAVLTIRLLKDAPHVIVDNITDIPTVSDIWKRLKMPEYSKGRLYTPEILEFMSKFYADKSSEVPFFREVSAAFESFKNTDGSWRKMRFASIADEASESMFNSTVRYEAWINDQRNLYGDAFMTQAEASEAVSSHQNLQKSVVDSPTYLTKENFLFHMAQLGIRKEWLNLDSHGNIIGFKSGAIKPKGVHVEVLGNGGMTVYYDKTAFFFDPKVDALLKRHGLDGLSFESGNKVNKYRENNTQPLRDKYINSDRRAMALGETIFNDIEVVLNTRFSQVDLIELPLSTFNVSNISREHSGKSGANMGVHIDHNVGLSAWMGLQRRVDLFEAFLTRASSNEYAMTSVALELLGKKNDTGDLALNKIPIEQIMQEGGLVVDQWMGDIVADKLFTYFFEGAKIGTADVGNSSISPMAPPIHHKASEIDQSIRTKEIIGGTTIYRQRIIGDYTPDGFHLNKQFSFNGRPNTQYGGDVSNTAEGNFFVKRITYNLHGEDRVADFNIIPTKAKKNGEQTWVITGNGFELRADRMIDLNNKVNGAPVEHKGDYSQIYNDIQTQGNALYLKLISLQKSRGGLTNADAAKFMLKNYNDYKLGIINNRQPRNLINDVVINKVSVTKETTQFMKGVKLSKLKVGVDENEGNKSMQNYNDAITTQDSDYDYDKSSSYFSVPNKFLQDVSKKAGYGLRNDSYSFAEKMFAELNTRLDDNHSMKRHLAIVTNSAMLRGRLVKMHNIVTYFMNAFKDQRVLGTFTDKNKQYQIRMKGESEYFMTADNISNWAKMFIDNYKNPTDLYNVQPLVENILFGKEARRDNGAKYFEGLFEITDTNGNVIHKVIDGGNLDIRRVIYNKMVKPLSKYLRFNRGMSEDQQGQSTSLRLKDIANGFETLRQELDNPWLYVDYGFKKGNQAYTLDLKPGMQTISDYVIGGWGDRKHALVSSENPFDVAMRTLTSVYNKSIEGLNRPKNIGVVEDIMLRAEAGVLLDLENIPRSFTRQSLSDALWKYVKNDFDYIQVTKLAYRLEHLRKQRYLLKMNKFSDPEELKTIDSKMVELEAIKSDIELRLGGQYEYDNKTAVTVTVGRQEIGKYQASKDMVFWDKDGNMKGVIEAKQTNRFDIYPTDVAVIDGKRFELVNPQVQKQMTAKHLAFGSLPMESTGNTSDISFLGTKRFNRVILPIYVQADVEIKMLNKSFKKGKYTPTEYSVMRKAILSKYLNHDSITSPLERKALIWLFLKPEINRRKIAYHKTVNGEHVNSELLYENPKSKPMWSLLLDIHNGDTFIKGNNISKAEAKALLSEITQRQTLASLGVSSPHLEVAIDYKFGGFNGRRNRDLYAELNREELNKRISRMNNPEDGERALGILNDFMNRERLLTPADAYRLEQLFDISDGLIFKHNATDSSIPVEPKRAYGQPAKESPIDFIDRIYYERRKARKDKECSQ